MSRSFSKGGTKNRTFGATENGSFCSLTTFFHHALEARNWQKIQGWHRDQHGRARVNVAHPKPAHSLTPLKPNEVLLLLPWPCLTASLPLLLHRHILLLLHNRHLSSTTERLSFLQSKRLLLMTAKVKAFRLNKKGETRTTDVSL